MDLKVAATRAIGLCHCVGRAQNLDKEIRKRVELFFGTELVLETVIHKNVGIAEAAALQKSVVEYSSFASGTFDFTKLTQELIQETTYEESTARRSVGKLEQGN